jgi:hypothetical protein
MLFHARALRIGRRAARRLREAERRRVGGERHAIAAELHSGLHVGGRRCLRTIARLLRLFGDDRSGFRAAPDEAIALTRFVITAGKTREFSRARLARDRTLEHAAPVERNRLELESRVAASRDGEDHIVLRRRSSRRALRRRRLKTTRY